MLNKKFGNITTFLQLQKKNKDNYPLNFQKITPETSDSDKEDKILNKLMEINFIQKKNPATDVVTTKCKIKCLIILDTVVDPNANFTIMTDDIAKRLNLRINTSERYDL